MVKGNRAKGKVGGSPEYKAIPPVLGDHSLQLQIQEQHGEFAEAEAGLDSERRILSCILSKMNKKLDRYSSTHLIVLI